MYPRILKLVLAFLVFPGIASGQISVSDKPVEKTVVFGNSRLLITLDYNMKCVVTEMLVNNQSVLHPELGIFSEIRTSGNSYSSRKLSISPEIKTTRNTVIISNIVYGDGMTLVKETWTFSISESDIEFDIERTIPKTFIVEEVAFPSINFKNMSTWEGAFTGYGGLAWFYLFNEKQCTYGVHSGNSLFWNSSTGNALSIKTNTNGKQVSSKFARSAEDHLIYSLSVSDNEMTCRYDTDTRRRRFIRGKTDVWDTFSLETGKYIESVTFSWTDYNKSFNRGNFAGINGKLVTSLLNTIARIGVIDAGLFGANSWHTPYGPICLHEQYIAQLGIAINDQAYTDGYKQCLEYYRDHAIQQDGRVLARWAYTNEDAMPGTSTPEGFYEAQWGYLLDSNPDFVTNVAELYNQCGDLKWVQTFKHSCEQALDYILKRDSDGNYLVEVLTDSHTEKRGSDWIDIIWASYENAFINAKLYYALILWSCIETQLGDTEKALYYSNFASLLKSRFNKPVEEGGFWSEKNKWYVHWLDKDNSVHGNNLAIPVNFMAIAYGICDDDRKKRAILDQVEEQMQKEKLFAWPLCMYSYARGEGNNWQFPFPNYENGDIFLSWGALGVESYASYKPELALKYIENILDRYEKDGLAFQRYGRLKQDGLGDDILSGNSLAIVGLYKSVYGLNPRYNRMYLNPHLPDRLSGTILNYWFRGEQLQISLETGRYSISNSKFTLISDIDFGFKSSDSLEYYHHDNDSCTLKAMLSEEGSLTLEIETWNEMERTWNQTVSRGKGKISYTLCGLSAEKKFSVSVCDKKIKELMSDGDGLLNFDLRIEDNKPEKIHIELLIQ